MQTLVVASKPKISQLEGKMAKEIKLDVVIHACDCSS